MIGALSALASNIFFGQGAWSPWQMYAWGMIGYVAGSLSNTRLMQHNIGVYIYGCIASLCFGLLMDTWTLIAFVHPITWPAALLNYSAGISFNLIHAVSTLVFLLVLLRPWRKKLERIRTKFGILDFPSQADDVSTLK